MRGMQLALGRGRVPDEILAATAATPEEAEAFIFQGQKAANRAAAQARIL
jgi:hypothetical protein